MRDREKRERERGERDRERRVDLRILVYLRGDWNPQYVSDRRADEPFD